MHLAPPTESRRNEFLRCTAFGPVSLRDTTTVVGRLFDRRRNAKAKQAASVHSFCLGHKEPTAVDRCGHRAGPVSLHPRHLYEHEVRMSGGGWNGGPRSFDGGAQFDVIAWSGDEAG